MSVKRLLPIFLLCTISCARIPTWRTMKGTAFGTFYNITYQSAEELDSVVTASLCEIDASLSLFNPNSALTAFNNCTFENTPKAGNGSYSVSLASWPLLYEVVAQALQVSKQTQGVFDITVAPLTRLYGFGPEGTPFIDQAKKDSVMNFVGYSHISLKDSILTKDDSRVCIDCGAIAKGYACDVVARALAACGVENMLVEIGGEIVMQGISPAGRNWRVGVQSPLSQENSPLGNLYIEGRDSTCGIATSGNYRNIRELNGKQVGHTLNPLTGQAAQNSLLSATVEAKNCILADAYATAFMVMGYEKAMAFLEANSNLKAILVYIDQAGEMKVENTISNANRDSTSTKFNRFSNLSKLK